MRIFEHSRAPQTAAASLLLALCLAGCSTSGPEGRGPADPTPDVHVGTVPDDGPTTTPLEPAREAAVSAEAESAAAWIADWDALACTGARAAADERDCQLLLMELATTADGAAAELTEHADRVPALAEAATRANEASDAAADWLGAWCGAYEDPACAAPGEALAEAERGLAASLDPWHDRGAPDA